MENKLKKETTNTINRLNMAGIRCIMCTGDNILTGLSVGIECGIINTKDEIIEIEIDERNHLVYNNIKTGIHNGESHKLNYIVTGNSFDIIRQNYSVFFDVLIESGAIFARMSPEQKQQVNFYLKKLN
jgi:cation-transporting ATPase 13A2